MNAKWDQVRHVAALARLEFTNDELEALSVQMSAILGFVDKLSELDLDNVPTAAQAHERYNVFREDEPTGSFPREAILANAPEQQDGCYVVPRIME